MTRPAGDTTGGDTTGGDTTGGDTTGGGTTGGGTTGTGGVIGGTTGGSDEASGELPFTGLPIWVPILLAGALLASGAFLLRRKRDDALLERPIAATRGGLSAAPLLGHPSFEGRGRGMSLFLGLVPGAPFAGVRPAGACVSLGTCYRASKGGSRFGSAATQPGGRHTKFEGDEG